MKKEIQELLKENEITFAEQTYCGDWLVSYSVFGYGGKEIKRRSSGKTLRDAIEKARQFKNLWYRKHKLTSNL